MGAAPRAFQAAASPQLGGKEGRSRVVRGQQGNGGVDQRRRGGCAPACFPGRVIYVGLLPSPPEFLSPFLWAEGVSVGKFKLPTFDLGMYLLDVVEVSRWLS